MDVCVSFSCVGLYPPLATEAVFGVAHELHDLSVHTIRQNQAISKTEARYSFCTCPGGNVSIDTPED